MNNMSLYGNNKWEIKIKRKVEISFYFVFNCCNKYFFFNEKWAIYFINENKIKPFLYTFFYIHFEL